MFKTQFSKDSITAVIIIAIISLLAWSMSKAQAAVSPEEAPAITVCRETVDEAFLDAYSGWDFGGSELILTFSGIDWNAESTWWTGEAISEVATGNLTVWAEGSAMFGYWDWDIEQYITVEGNGSTISCDDVFEGDAPSIAVVITTDCAFVEIDNGDGGWSRVESNGEPVLLHYGESLIAGRSQSLAADDYRAVPTACY